MAPIGGREILQQNVLVLHRPAEALLRVDRRVEAEDLELQEAYPEEVVGLQPMALPLPQPDPYPLRGFAAALAQVHVVAAEGVADAEPLAPLQAGDPGGAH